MSAATQSVRPEVSTHQMLVARLVETYDKTMLPVFGNKKKLVVTFSLGLRRIINFDQKDQVITLNVELRHTWHDERLTWNPSDYNSTHKIYIKSSRLWTPDITVFDSVNPSSSQIDRSIMSTVHHTGSVYFRYQFILAVSCMLHFDVFPYDSQSFAILFGSLSYKRAALTISVPEGAAGVDTRMFEPNNIWRLSTAYSTNKDFCRTDNIHPTTTFIFKMSRNSKTLEKLIINPMIVSSVIMVAQFILPCDSTEKIAVGVGLTMKTIVYMLLIHDLISLSETPPRIVVFAIFFMGQLLASQIISISVLALHYNAVRSNLLPMPQWVKTVFLNVVAKMVGRSPSVRKDYVGATVVPLYGNCALTRDRQMSARGDVLGSSGRRQTMVPRIPGLQIREDSAVAQETRKPSMRHRSIVMHLNKDCCELLVEQIRIMTEISDRLHQQDTKEWIVDQWQQVAMVINRLCFYVFGLINVIGWIAVILEHSSEHNDQGNRHYHDRSPYC